MCEHSCAVCAMLLSVQRQEDNFQQLAISFQWVRQGFCFCCSVFQSGWLVNFRAVPLSQPLMDLGALDYTCEPLVAFRAFWDGSKRPARWLRGSEHSPCFDCLNHHASPCMYMSLLAVQNENDMKRNMSNSLFFGCKLSLFPKPGIILATYLCHCKPCLAVSLREDFYLVIISIWWRTTLSSSGL